MYVTFQQSWVITYLLDTPAPPIMEQREYSSTFHIHIQFNISSFYKYLRSILPGVTMVLTDTKTSIYRMQMYYTSLSGSFIRVLLAFNKMPHKCFDDVTKFLIIERRSERWISLGTITNSLQVMKLNVYETIEWNSPLRVDVSSTFHLILNDMTVLKTTHKTTHWDKPCNSYNYPCHQVHMTFTAAYCLHSNCFSAAPVPMHVTVWR